MAVVRNLMIRIGADYSGARKAMQGATRDLGKFKRDVTTTTTTIRGRKGLGGIDSDFKRTSGSVSNSLSKMRGTKGIGGVVAELGNLTPAIGGAISQMGGLGVAALGAGSRFGVAGIAIAGFVAVLGAATVALYRASQPAVKFEADLGRLNMQLKSGSRDFMQWARAQGLAKQTAVEMGATYGTLISSFIRDTNQLQTQTKNLVQASRVVASATGRSIEDVLERMRSGLLGNTEAIEDLGIFVNVSMIESTKAFQQFANGKHWDQLDFRVQQQIRLAAILEQAHARYGNEVQNNVMTKQSRLIEQLKDIKLNLSQAFLPIWDAILPALIRLSEAIAYTTEQIARFVYWLRGWDYDEQTMGAYQYTESVSNLGDAYEETGEKAAKARSELAAFDRLNLLGSPSGGGGTGGSGGRGGSPGGGSDGGGGNNNGPSFPFPDLPPLPKLQLKFDLPSPPDAGIGAVATAVVATVNGLIAEIKLKMAQMWSDLELQTQTGIIAQQAAWGQLTGNLTGVVIPGLATGVILGWRSMLDGINSETIKATPAIVASWNAIKANVASISNPLTAAKAAWKDALSTMQQDLNAYRPYLEWGWKLIALAVRNPEVPLADAKAKWKDALSFMQQQLNAYRPYLEHGWKLLAIAVRGLESPLASVKSAWSSALTSMKSTAVSTLGTIIEKIGDAISAWNKLKQALSSPLPSPSPSPSPSPAPSPGTAPQTSPASGLVSGLIASAKSQFSQDTLMGLWSLIKDEANKPENKAAFSIYSAIVPISKAASYTGKVAAPVLKQAKAWWDSLKGMAIPAFASGGLVYGPTLAMVGDNRNAANDPEVIAPLSKLEGMIEGTGDNGEVVRILQRVEQAIRDLKHIQAVISQDDVGSASANWINEKARRGGNPLPNL